MKNNKLKMTEEAVESTFRMMHNPTLYTEHYRVLQDKGIPWCCGSCQFIRYKTGNQKCKILEVNVCMFGFCDEYTKSYLI